jgi:predicted PurR-regulated permease PerM
MNRATRVILVLAGLVVVGAGIKAAEAIMVPFLLSIFLATIAATPVFWLQQRRVPASIAIVLVMAGFVTVLLLLGALVAQSVGEFTARIPFYQARLTELVLQLTAWIERLDPRIDVSTELLLAQFDPGTALALAGNLLRGFGNTLSNGFLILLTMLFILAEASSFPRKLRAVLPNPERDMPYFAKFAADMNRYIAIKTTVSAMTGIAVWLSLALIGVDFPVLWGLLAFLLNYIPNIGSIIAAVPAVLLALVQLDFLAAVLTMTCYVAINMLFGNLVEPRFMGRGLGLSTLVVFLSLILWGWLLGPVGMLLSVPLTMTAKLALEASPSGVWLAHLLDQADSVWQRAAAQADESQHDPAGGARAASISPSTGPSTGKADR